MASDPSYSVQVAVAAALLGSSAVTDLVGQKVHDELDAATAAPALPYILIGDDQVIDDSTQCSDGAEVVCNVHIFADGPAGRLDAKLITGLAMTALRSIEPDGFTAQDDPEMSVVHRIDPDGSTAHSVLTLTYLVNPAA